MKKTLHSTRLFIGAIIGLPTLFAGIAIILVACCILKAGGFKEQANQIVSHIFED